MRRSMYITRKAFYRPSPIPRYSPLCLSPFQQYLRFISATSCTSSTSSPSPISPETTYSSPQTPQKERTTAESTFYTLFPETFPQGPPPAGPFTPSSLRTLRSEFLRLQQSTHPDLFPPSQRSRAEAASAHLNRAYTTLLDPLQRAHYLLTLRGYEHPAEDESAKLEDQDLLMEVLDAQE